MSSHTTNPEIEQILKTDFKLKNMGAEYDKDVLHKLKNFEVRDSDIFLIGHLKTGTTWASEMIWLIGNDLDFEGAKTFIDERFPVLEVFTFDAKSGNEDIDERIYHTDSMNFIEKLKGRRFIKTHLRGPYLPLQIQNRSKKPKIIYITRNIKDTCVSYYHYFKSVLKMYTGNFEDFCKVYLAGRMGSGNYWDHVLYFWNRRDEPNVLFIKYEDMKRNLRETIRKVAAFLDKPLNEEQINVLIERLNFNTMKDNPAVNHDDLYKQSGFIRSGKVGSFKEDMSPELIKKFDEFTKNSLVGTGLDMQ